MFMEHRSFGPGGKAAPSRPGRVFTVSPLSPQSCQADLVKDNGHKYFLSVLADPYMPVRPSGCRCRPAPPGAPGKAAPCQGRGLGAPRGAGTHTCR